MSLELVNTIGLFTSPVIAVVVTLFWQQRKEKRDRKDRLFLTLMAHRRTYPPSQSFVDSLNLVDTVFGDEPKVVGLWHEYYDLLGSAGYASEGNRRTHKYLEMLTEMAKVLGYKTLQQTDIDKFYSPTAHGNEADISWRIKTELLRVLQGAQHLVIPSQPFATEQSSPPPALHEAAPNAGTPASTESPDAS